MLRYVLLALLTDGEAKHGYALMKAYSERSGTRLSIGNVYRELQRLVGERLITAAVNPEGADPRRMPYTISSLGREALSRWLAMPAHALLRTQPDVLSYRLALLGDLDPDAASAFLKDLRDELWVQSKAVERERAMVSQQDRVAEGALPMRSILLGRRMRHLAADIELVAEIQATFQAAQKRSAPRVPRLAIEPTASRRPRPKQRRGYRDEA